MLVYKWTHDVQVIKGYNRACIYDLKRKEYYLAPNSIDDLIRKVEGKSDNQILLKNEYEKEWFDFCIEKEFFFVVPASTYKNFLELSLVWKTPSIIISAIIDVNDNINKLLEYVDYLDCKHIMLKCKTIDELDLLLNKEFSTTNFQSLDVILDYFDKAKADLIKSKFPIVNNIFPYIENNNKLVTFNVNIQHFSEAHHFNTYFNRKVYIDNEGFIKNTPESDKEVVNINEIKSKEEFKKSILSMDFIDLWDAKKDLIDVCKDCEFRYMCVDNRIPNKRNNNSWYYKEECDYNPFINKWNNESKYLSLIDCGVTVNKKNYSVDNDQIEKINNKLWN